VCRQENQLDNHNIQRAAANCDQCKISINISLQATLHFVFTLFEELNAQGISNIHNF